MTWTPRQQAMMKAMGLRTWQPPAGAVAARATEPVRVDPTPGQAARSRRDPAPARDLADTAQVRANTNLLQRANVASPSPLGTVDAVDWAALPAAVAACQACGLCQSRQQPVVSVGQPGAHWMMVGEAPDGAEEAAGEPGAGPAGQLLDNMLRAVGLSRQADDAARQVVITSAVKCRPPRDRKPEPAELSACAPFLARQVALVRPRIILAMGKVAIRQVLGSDEPLGRLRGRVHHYGDTPVIATYDAAYLMRQPADKAKAWEDLCLAVAVVAGSAPQR
jgi:uracil-DNA glycosylase